MGDNSDDYDDGPGYVCDAVGDPPFDVGDIVALDPLYHDGDDPELDLEGEVVDLKSSGRGWQVLVAWQDDDRTWVPDTRLVDAE
ncbi:hypothetical protein HH310_42110 [Actinoplanes sp. TBRC 11911]|uniref:hypothetical protein n=1 Tax=Actinoplanes sp. TBRC 11911 TaxID=2729386 RepID=UPI00145D59D3|nr:hypothetical protein [Actinoplanes sp. TBRC 11911]NMO57746.1 hypothetical protein [Actinoplanes sp. TBRC 11911]